MTELQREELVLALAYAAYRVNPTSYRRRVWSVQLGAVCTLRTKAAFAAKLTKADRMVAARKGA